MRIAVLSDTHDRLPEHVCEAIRGADEIWHLGDVCTTAIIIRLKQIAPLRFVSGNCDSHPDWPPILDFEMEGLRIHLEHIPARKPPPCDLFLHGHTHVPRDVTIGGVRFLNPGCITRPNMGAPASYAWLSLDAGQVMWKVVPV